MSFVSVRHLIPFLLPTIIHKFWIHLVSHYWLELLVGILHVV